MSVLLLALLLLVMFALLFVSACTGDADDQQISDDLATDVPLLPLTIATVPADDLLPLWVAQQAGIDRELGLDLDIVTFASSRDMLAAITANEAQGGSLSMLSVSQLTLGGIPTQAVMRLAPSRGAVVSSPGSGILQADQLAGVPVAASEASLEEFILYRALTAVGVPEDQILLEAVADLRARRQLLMADQIKASTMPWTLASVLGQQGANILVTEKDIEPFTSTVLGMRSDWLDQDGAAQTVAVLWEVWNRGADLINADPDAYLDLLVEAANLPEESIQGGYDMQVYASARLPERQQVEDILEWAYRKGYAEEVIPFEEFVYE